MEKRRLNRVRQNKFQLMERDISIFTFLFENRVASIDQIGRKAFQNAKRPTIRLRLEKLVKSGYLWKSYLQLSSRVHVYYGLGQKGLAEFQNLYRYPITNPILKSDSVAHDLTLVDIRECLEKKKKVKEYLQENVLQSCGSFLDSENYRPLVILNTDATFILDTPSGQYRIALEYEFSPKEQSRLAKKLLEYYLAPEIDAVFYVCKNKGIQGLIRRIDSEVGKDFDSKVYTCAIKNFQNSDQIIPFTGRENTQLLVD